MRPAATTTDLVAGEALHRWQTPLLPWLDQQPLYDAIDLTRPWSDLLNAPHYRTPVDEPTNPGAAYWPPPTDPAVTHYAANTNGIVDAPPLTLSDVTDGVSNTIFAGEINTNFPPWGQPRNVRDPGDGLHTSSRTFGGPWTDGSTQFRFLDGRVRTIKPGIDPWVLKALATPAGGEAVTPP